MVVHHINLRGQEVGLVQVVQTVEIILLALQVYKVLVTVLVFRVFPLHQMLPEFQVQHQIILVFQVLLVLMVLQ